MAPSVDAVGLRSATFTVPLKTDTGHNKENLIGYKYERETELQGTEKIAPASYPNYLPVWDNETARYDALDKKSAQMYMFLNGPRYPPLSLFEHYDHGKDADPGLPDLLPRGLAEVDDITPFIGSEVHGVQLSKLSDAGKDQLALFVAQRRVVGMSTEYPRAASEFCSVLSWVNANPRTSLP